jgi:hypothetical protein
MQATIKIRRRFDSSKVKFSPLTERIKKITKYIDDYHGGDMQDFIRVAQEKKVVREKATLEAKRSVSV